MEVPLYLREEKSDRSVRKVAGYKVDNQYLIPSRDRNFSFFATCPDWLWSPHSFHSNDY
jgi:hypothetical protein